MNGQRIAVVTGANKGIGYAIVKNFALQYSQSPLRTGSLLIYLTSRDNSRAEEALRHLYQDADLRASKALASDGGLATIRKHQLDISQPTSISNFADFLKREHPDGIDFVVNNAGMAMQGFDSNVVEQTLRCNYYGTLMATQVFLPLVKSGGRLVNVSSIVGNLGKYPGPIRDRFRTAKSVSDVNALMEEFKAAVKAGKESAQGWPSAAYAVSKAGCTGMTLVIAREQQEKGSNILVNACCPGWVKTDMTRGRGPKTTDEGAQTPVMLSLSDIGGKSGLFWTNERPQDW